MAMTPALRLLLPRRGYISRYQPLALDGPLNVTRNQLERCRYASSKTPPPTSTATHKPKVFEKPRRYIPETPPPPPPPPPPPKYDSNVLEKPSRYNRPSHPVQTHRPPPRHFPGPKVSPQKAEERNKKKYPNMMPPVGSFMYWFLTNAEVHMWITLSVLFSLACYTAITTFQRTSPFAELLPPIRLFLAHPISYIHQYWRVFKLHTDQNTLNTAALRLKRDNDIEKRRAYRIAHGTERKQQGFIPWMGLAEDDEDDKKAATAGDAPAVDASASEPGAAAPAGAESPQLATTEESMATTESPQLATTESPQLATTTEGSVEPDEQPPPRRKRPPVKRWFGIWT